MVDAMSDAVERAARAAHDLHWDDGGYPCHEHERNFWEATARAAILAFLTAADEAARAEGDAEAVAVIGRLRESVK